MAIVNDKVKKIIAMIDGATTEGEARAASLALQRLLAANDLTLEDIDLTEDAPVVNETGEEVGKRVAVWVKVLANVIAGNYRCETYIHTDREYDFWAERRKVTGTRIVFVGEAEDSVVAAGCFRATKHAVENCFAAYVAGRYNETGEKIGRKSGAKSSYCLGFIDGLKRAYAEQVAADESLALAVVVPKSVTHFLDSERNIKRGRRQVVTLSADDSIREAGAADGYGFGSGDRIAAV